MCMVDCKQSNSYAVCLVERVIFKKEKKRETEKCILLHPREQTKRAKEMYDVEMCSKSNAIFHVFFFLGWT